MILYKTVAGEAIAEQTIEKSRFITYVKPVSSREEADAFVKEIKARHKDATHNVPAMVIGDKMQIQWASDDGEPSGTSGAPIVQMLVSEEITNVCLVVTRYFGGIKLGTGGLVRAYTSSAKLGIEAAGIKEVAERFFEDAEVDYTYLSAFQRVDGERFMIESIDYGEKVKILMSVQSEQTAELKAQIRELSQGKAKIISEYNKNT